MKKCDVCGGIFQELSTNVYGNSLCDNCWTDYMETEESWAESFTDFAEIPEEEWVSDLEDMVNVWLEAKAGNKLDMPGEKIKETEDRFVKYAAEYGITVDLAAGTVSGLGDNSTTSKEFKEYEDLWN